MGSRRNEQWRPGPVVAWTETDGPGRVPPEPSRRIGVAAAISLGVALAGILTSHSVCPDHALWIDVVASVTMVLGTTAIVATVKSSATGPTLALAAATGGIIVAGIGLAHEVTRSRVVLSAFGLAAIASALSAHSSLRLRRWESSVLADAVAPIGVPASPDAPVPGAEMARSSGSCGSGGSESVGTVESVRDFETRSPLRS